MEVFINDREFSDIEIFQHSGKGIPLFMTCHKNCLQSDYFFVTGPSSYKKRIYRAAVSQRLRNTGLEHNSLFVGLGGWGGICITLYLPTREDTNCCMQKDRRSGKPQQTPPQVPRRVPVFESYELRSTICASTFCDVISETVFFSFLKAELAGPLQH
jgi:hypothetical protein